MRIGPPKIVLVLVVILVSFSFGRSLAGDRSEEDDDETRTNEHEHDWGGSSRYTRKQGQLFEKGIGGANISGRRRRLPSRQQSAWATGLPFSLPNYLEKHI